MEQVSDHATYHSYLTSLKDKEQAKFIKNSRTFCFNHLLGNVCELRQSGKENKSKVFEGILSAINSINTVV